MGESIQFSDLHFGEYLMFLLDHPEVRQCTPWSDKALKKTVDEWIAIAGLTQSSRVLDIGCGYGLFTIEIARRGHFAVGVEYAEGVFLDMARKLSAEAGVKVKWVGDRFPCEVGEEFDLVCIINNLSLWKRPLEIIEEIKHRLKREGFLITGCSSQFCSFPEYRTGPWIVRGDGSIIDTRTGKGIRLKDAWMKETVKRTHTSLEQVLHEAGFIIIATNPWLVGKVPAEQNII